MGRTLLCSLAGAGAGFLVGFVVVLAAQLAQNQRATQYLSPCLWVFSSPVPEP